MKEPIEFRCRYCRSKQSIRGILKGDKLTFDEWVNKMANLQDELTRNAQELFFVSSPKPNILSRPDAHIRLKELLKKNSNQQD